MTRVVPAISKVRESRGIVWCDHAFFPTHIGFAPNERAFVGELRRHGFSNEYPGDDACVTHYDSKAGDLTYILTVGDHMDARFRSDKVGMSLVLCHEAVHVWQGIRCKMAEEEPSAEFEAYAIQFITEQLCDAYLKTRGAKARPKRPRPPTRKRRNARRSRD